MQEKLLPRLTFNTVLALTGFRHNNPAQGTTRQVCKMLKTADFTVEPNITFYILIWLNVL